MFDELEIQKLNNKYNFKRCEVFSDKLYIESNYGSWIVYNNENYFQLMHQNKKAKKCRTHEQRKYNDLNLLFHDISNHDKWKIKVRL